MVLACLVAKGALLAVAGDFTRMNPDEESNYTIALNHVEGRGYTIDGRATSFHASFPVFVYEQLIRRGVSRSAYIAAVHVLGILLFAVSLGAFHRLVLTFTADERVSLGATALYAFYPPGLVHIGNAFFYEKLAMPVLVVVVWALVAMASGRESRGEGSARPHLRGWHEPLIACAVALSCLLRPQMIAVYGLLFAVVCASALFGAARTARVPVLRTSVLTAVLVVVTHLPILAKNERLFGEPVLSTQVGFELMQGHSEIARGSWYGDWYRPESEFARYSREVLPGLEDMNELEESRARGRFALEWIRAHPGREAVLVARKLAIYFLPRNYEAGFHPLNALVHVAFAAALLLWLVGPRAGERALWLVAPVAASVLLSVVFFVGYRWRFYAEPFMIAFAATQLTLFARARGWLPARVEPSA